MKNSKKKRRNTKKRNTKDRKLEQDLVAQLPEQTHIKPILKKLEELLHDSNRSIFMENYSAITRTGKKLTETHKIK